MRGQSQLSPGRSARVAIALLAVCMLGVTAGCGGDDDSGGSATSSDGSKLTTIKVGFTASAPRAPLYVGINQGFFEDEGLKVEPVPLDSASAGTAAVNSGQVQIGGGAMDGMLLAAANGVPIKIVAPANSSGVPKSDTSNDVTNTVLVKKDSPIRTAADLQGKTIAVSQLKGLFELGIRATAERKGLDPNSFKFRVLPFPEALQAVLSGKVDAAAEVEPFIASGLGKGARSVMNIYPWQPSEFDDWLTGVWFTSSKYYESNKDIVERFARGVAKSNAYSAEHPDMVRQVIPEFTEVEPAVANKIALGGFPTSLDINQAKRIAELQAKYGFVSKPADVDNVVVQAAGE
jgi:NitT/TauT family transport system substrate-binding protein